jgi:hypothetical protein
MTRLFRHPVLKYVLLGGETQEAVIKLLWRVCPSRHNIMYCLVFVVCSIDVGCVPTVLTWYDYFMLVDATFYNHLPMADASRFNSATFFIFYLL